MSEIKPVALIVDDEPDLRELVCLTISEMGIAVREAGTIAEAKTVLAAVSCRLCLTDMRLPDGSGFDLVEYAQKNMSHMPIAVITAYGNVELAVSSLKAGAFDFISKPLDIKVLRDLVNTGLRLTEQSRDAEIDASSQAGLLGDSAAIAALRKKIIKVARSQAPVHITGPSGSGKELVARLIHQHGARHDKVFMPVNCGAIPSELMESEFFGHKKGSFTGAMTDKDGLFQAASGGTLFLDEVAELPLPLQVKLLRAIQEKAVRPVGAQLEVSVDIRILSASHKSLSQLVERGEFRHDLYYRINVIEIKVPALHERIEDVAILARTMLENLAGATDLDKVELTTAALNKLRNYSFPGNVRELENILERALTLCENCVITEDDIQLPECTSTGGQFRGPEKLNPYLGDVERDAIIAALEKTKWNKTAAAKLLGITLRAMRYRIKKYGIG